MLVEVQDKGIIILRAIWQELLATNLIIAIDYNMEDVEEDAPLQRERQQDKG